MDYLICQIEKVLENYFSSAKSAQITAKIFEIIEKEAQKDFSKEEKENVWIDRFGPGGDLWHPF